VSKKAKSLTVIALSLFLPGTLFPAQANKPNLNPSAVVIQGKPTQYTGAITAPQTMLQVRSKHLKKDNYYLVNVQLRFSALWLWTPIECALVTAMDSTNQNLSSSPLLSHFTFVQGAFDNEKSAPPPTENVKQMTGIVRGSGTDLSVVCRPFVLYQRTPGTDKASVIAKAEIITLGKVTFVNE